MALRTLSLTFLLLLTCFVQRAVASADSLRNVWNNASVHDTVRLSAAVDLVKGFLPNYPDSAFSYCDKMQPMAVRSKSDKYLGHVLTFKGIASHVMGDYVKSFQYHKEALAIRQRLGDDTNAARNLQNLGIVCKSLGQFSEALKYYQQSLDIHQRKGNKSGVAATLGSMGMAFFEQGYRSGTDAMRREVNTKALDYLDRALVIRKELGDQRAYILTLSNRAVVLYELGRIEESMQTHQECYRIAVELGDKLQESSSLNNLGVAYSAMAEAEQIPAKRDSLYARSLESYQQGLAIREELGHSDYVINSLTNIASVTRSIALSKPAAQKRTLLTEALDYAQRSMVMAEESESVREQGLAAETLYLILKDLGRYEEALRAHEVYTTAKDSISSIDKRDDLMRQELTYDFEKKTMESEMAHQQSLADEKGRQNRLKFGLAFVGLTLVFALSALVLNRRAARRLAQKNAQIAAEKERAERSEAAKQRFLANMSHEIRTPMNAISGISRLLLDKDVPEKHRHYLEAIRRSSDNLLVLLNDVLDESRIEAGKLEIRHVPFDAASELDALVEMHTVRATEKGLELRKRIEENVPTALMGDPSRVCQIISNLLGNAIKFTEKGSVEVHMSYVSGKLMVEVQDTGSGIAAADRDRIFEVFEQAEGDARSGGTGLGLAISRQLARLMGGGLMLRDSGSSGSCFVLELPLAVSDVPVARKSELRAQPVSAHLIVAEDDEYNFIVTEETIRKFYPGATVHRARNGAEVIALLEEDEYDLVLMDMRMPVMDGYTTVREMRARGWQIPVIAFTASVLRSEVDTFYAAGMNGYVPKPFTDEQFTECLSAWLIQTTGPQAAPDQRGLFLRFMPDRLSLLNAALANGDERQLREILHAMRPQLISCGLGDLDNLAREAENDTVENGIFEKVRKLEQEIRMVLETWTRSESK
jgi:signal transduction histidine kinase/CheY-like chemotaxis protein/tetratricopeptide (TPR) repeat protein